MIDCAIRRMKTKELISFAVTAKQVYAFVFAYAKCWFSHSAAEMEYSPSHFFNFETLLFCFELVQEQLQVMAACGGCYNCFMSWCLIFCAVCTLCMFSYIRLSLDN